MNLRQHQRELSGVIDRIISGDQIRKIIVHACPGSGKSLLPIIAGKLITAGLADAIAWIVPRTSLQDQGERGFLDPFFRKMIGHSLTIRSSTNEENPCRGQHGITTTYQALGMDEGRTVLRDFERRRYILVLDEFHHISSDDSAWNKAIQPLVDRAKYLVLMTGTLERGDGKKIAFIPYLQTGKDAYVPDLSHDDQSAYIHYSRSMALLEQAIIPIRFILSDGRVEWETKEGQTKAGKLSAMHADSGAALFTALNTEFAEDLLDRGIEHWKRWKERRPSSKLLVVSANINAAKTYLKYLKNMGLCAKIATSDDSKASLANIKEFKYGVLDILSTCAVCYEGLDCPQISHIICLTHIRSVPWIIQCVARAVRIDPAAGPYESQVAFVFAPDDPMFSRVVQQIKREQLPVAVQGEGRGTKEEKEGGDGEAEPWITPINGEIMGSREISFYGDGIPDGSMPPPIIQTIREIEDDLLHRIENHVVRFSFENYYKPQRINGEIKGRFGKGRGEMTIDELRECLEWVTDAYPLNGGHGYGQSKPRGKGRRVPSKAYTWEGR